MSHVLFEDPKYLMLFAGIIDFLLLFSLKRIPFEKKKIPILILTLLIPIFHITAKLVETDNEKVEKVLITISENSSRLQVDAVTEFLDDAFQGKYDATDYNKETFIDLLKEKVGTKVINDIKFTKKEIHFENKKARSTIISHVYFTSKEGVFTLSLEWKVIWHKKGEQWLMFNTSPPRLVRF